jgi:hypothetical protein
MNFDDVFDGAMAGSSGSVAVDSVTQLGPHTAGKVAICGSHGGRYSGTIALAGRVRGIIFHDAGVGLDRAGIGGLDVLQRYRVPAAAVLSSTALIGDAQDMLRNGRIGHLNDSARALGCTEGMTVSAAAELMKRSPGLTAATSPFEGESRTLIMGGLRTVWALDSASLVTPSDAGSVVITGSHGQLLGGDPRSALRVAAAGAVFNDAGVPNNGPGGRLDVLADRGIPATTVAASSARIGEGRSSYTDGIISRVNDPASRAGAELGMSIRDFVELLLTPQ